MHVVAHCSQISVPTPIHNQCFVAAAEKMSENLVTTVKAIGVGPHEPFHPGDQIGPRCFQHKVEMRPHEAVRMNLPVRFGAGFPKRFQEQSPVLPRSKHRRATVPAIHHMVNGAFIFQAQLSCHNDAYPTGKAPNMSILRTDPFTDSIAGRRIFSSASTPRTIPAEKPPSLMAALRLRESPKSAAA